MENSQKMLEQIIETAVRAGEKILEIYDGMDFDIEYKKDQSPLTIADRESHEIIEHSLKETSIPILSEEGKEIPYSERSKWDRFWLVDPLDGTKEFIKRNGEFTVNIALIEKQVPIMGVVYAPVTTELYYADHHGAYKMLYQRGTVLKELINSAEKLPARKNSDRYVVIGSRSHMSRETEEFIKKIDTGGKPLEIISKGSSLKICLVAEGAADCYPRLAPTMEWDTAAGHAVALFAGSTVNIYNSEEPLKYNKENLLNPWFVVQR